MNISDLKAGTKNVNLEAEVVSIEAPREIQSRAGQPLKVANATLRDSSGTITLVLWNDDIDKVQEGAQVRVENGYVNTWQNQSQLTLGKFGKMTVVQ